MHHKRNIYLANRFTKRMAKVTYSPDIFFESVIELLLYTVNFILFRCTVLLTQTNTCSSCYGAKNNLSLTFQEYVI